MNFRTERSERPSNVLFERIKKRRSVLVERIKRTLGNFKQTCKREKSITLEMAVSMELNEVPIDGVGPGAFVQMPGEIREKLFALDEVPQLGGFVTHHDPYYEAIPSYTVSLDVPEFEFRLQYCQGILYTAF